MKFRGAEVLAQGHSDLKLHFSWCFDLSPLAPSAVKWENRGDNDQTSSTWHSTCVLIFMNDSIHCNAARCLVVSNNPHIYKSKSTLNESELAFSEYWWFQTFQIERNYSNSLYKLYRECCRQILPSPFVWFNMDFCSVEPWGCFNIILSTGLQTATTNWSQLTIQDESSFLLQLKVSLFLCK